MTEEMSVPSPIHRVHDGTDPMTGGESVTVLAMGGTIDKVYNLAGQLEIGPPAAREILDVGRAETVTVETIVAKDSLDLTDADRDLLLDRIGRLQQGRAVITHGTDTMTQTADYLRRHPSAIAGKTLVITGALQPAAMRSTDAHFNLGAALVAAQLSPAGVYLCMNGRVFPAGSAIKDSTSGRFVTCTE